MKHYWCWANILRCETDYIMKIFRISMAIPSGDIMAKTYYHGTDMESNAKSILINGINPPDLSLIKNHMLRPVDGSVYLTDKVSVAAIYALGGDTASTSSSDESLKESRYGYVFSVPGKELVDVDPDEDSVGEFIYEKKYPLLNYIAENNVAPSRMRKLYDGEYTYWASVGKQIMKLIPYDLKIKMIEDGAHISHKGSVRPNGCWKIDKMDSANLKRDYSNFFELAERIV
jgi:hypothetical protein